MRSAGILVVAVVMTAFSSSTAGASSGAGYRDAAKGEPRVFTARYLRVGHRAAVRLVGFPGRGVVKASFFPTAICEEECGARSVQPGTTDASGEGLLRMRIPGTFFDKNEHVAYFRNRERVELEVTWEGSDHGFAAADAEPTILRSHHG